MTTNEPVALRAHAAPWHEGVNLLVRHALHRNAMVSRVVFEDVEDGVSAGPTFWLSLQDAQTLMDDLWQSGLRPTEGAGSAGAMAAQRRHLDDMRTLLFGSLGKGA